MANLNRLIRRSNNTCEYVETSNKTTGRTYFLSSNLHIMHVLTVVPTNHPSKYGMGFNPPLNHCFTCKPEYKVWTNEYDTSSKYAKRFRQPCYWRLQKCIKEKPQRHPMNSAKMT